MNYPILDWFHRRQGQAALPLEGPKLTFTIRRPLNGSGPRTILDCNERHLTGLTRMARLLGLGHRHPH